MNGTTPIVRLLLYTALLAGAVAFAFPFLWMASTSVKVDRELFRGAIDLRPEQPRPRAKSPYYEERQFVHVQPAPPQSDALLPLLTGRVLEAGPRLPPGDCVIALPELLAPGLYERVQRRAPASVWEGEPEALASFAGQLIGAAEVSEVARQAHRQVLIGALRVRSDRLEEVEIAADRPPAERWTVGTPEVIRLINTTDATLPCAAVEYDFSRGQDRAVLQATFDLPFPVEQLQRLQLRFRPDDTWHELRATLESTGVKRVARRPVSLADNQWGTLTWQMPGPDDHSTKIRTWIPLDETARDAAHDPGPGKARLTLELVRLSPLQAAYAKAKFNYVRVLDHIPFWRYVRVSILLVALNIILTLLASSLVAYAFARLQWPGRDALFLVMLGTMMIPGQVTMIPHFLIWKHAGAYDSLVPLWAGAMFGNAFFIFLMRQFLKGIPPDLEDAARIDGCGFLRIYWHVMLPLVKPSLAAIAIFTFMGTWNDFLGPLIYVNDQRLYPLAFGLYAFAVQVNNNPVLTMAGSVLMTVPVIVVFFAAQRYFIQGITLTGMKG